MKSGITNNFAVKFSKHESHNYSGFNSNTTVNSQIKTQPKFELTYKKHRGVPKKKKRNITATPCTPSAYHDLALNLNSP